ncbi:phosphatase PAP2 family protein [Sunxiuqinia sp. sy24]|uniref:phosphatase PAP2 family protein n=1 Tax=Sunxiuqinia sp. sy24 TaxID=3461495 RepID=UPI004045F1D1
MKINLRIAQFLSLLFHPLLIPTYGFLLLMNSGFYFSMLTFDAKKLILLIVFMSTLLFPLLSLGILSLNKRFNIKMDKSTDRVIPLLLTVIYYYLGYFYLGKLQVYPIYRIFLLSSILIIILLLLISMKWKISNHMAGIGGLIGAVLALSFRLGMNSSLLLIGLICTAGLIGSSRLLLKRHDPLQIYAGFFLGFAINYLVIIFL